MGATADTMWDRVEEIVDRAPNLESLRLHGVELVAARAWRRQGREVPTSLRKDERRAALKALAAPLVLKRVRDCHDGTLVLMKGPEVAGHYPEPGLRSFRDLDLLVADAAGAQRDLLAHGFVEIGDPARYEKIHHLRPLTWPGLPLAIELHHEPKYVAGLHPPPIGELMRLTQPSATGVDGVLAPTPAVHALLLAAHAWAHQPLGRLLDLIDVAVMLGRADRVIAWDLARKWGHRRMWSSTLAVTDALLLGRPRPAAAHLWCRHLAAVRERTVLETHLTRFVAPASGLSGGRAFRASIAGLTEAAHRRSDERWPDALRRASLAVGDAFVARSEHDRTIDRRAEDEPTAPH